MQNWTLLYSAQTLPEANIIKGMLEENEVPVMLMNRQDSSYLNFGLIEVYVPPHLQPIAAQLIEKSFSN